MPATDAAVFILGTKSAPQHTASTANALSSQGITFQTWETDDADTPRPQHGERLGNPLWLRAHYGSAKPTEIIANYLAHHRLMQHALKHSIQRIIAIEAGSLPDPGFKHIAKHIAQLDPAFEFITLSTNQLPHAIRHQDSTQATPLGSRHQLLPALNESSSSCGYTASLSGLRKIAPRLMPIRTDLETALAQIHWLHSLRAFEIWPQAVFQDAARPHIAWDRAKANAARPVPARILSTLSATLTRTWAGTILQQNAAQHEQRLKAYRRQLKEPAA